jgi:hypothetical protein
MKLRPVLAAITAITIAAGGATAQVRHHGNVSSPSIIRHQDNANLQAQDSLSLSLQLPLPPLPLPPLLDPNGPPTCC